MKCLQVLLALAVGVAAVDVRFLGRVNPKTRELTWPGTGISFSFTGTYASIPVTAVSGASSVDLIVDGGAPIVISNVDQNPIKTPTLKKGTHSVILRKRSETYFGTFSIGNVTSDGTIITYRGHTRQIEVIGDSITVGYGLEGPFPCVNTAVFENNLKTYGALTGDHFGADYNVVAWSGKGITRNYVTTTPDTSPIMPQLYTHYGANDADNSYTPPADWKPQAVVINLGTNDYSYIAYDASGQPYNARNPLDTTTYQNAMVSFTQGIQKRWPNAHYFLMTSPLLSDTQRTSQAQALKTAVAQLGAKAHFVDWPQQGSTYGCDYHPNAGTQAIGANQLIAAMGPALGW